MKPGFNLKVLLVIGITFLGMQPVLVSALPAKVQEDLRSRNYKLNTLFRLSGLDDTLKNVENIAQMAGNIREDALAPGQEEFARGLISQAISSRSFYRLLKQPFYDDYKPEYARSAIQWYRSPLGKKILRLENEASDPSKSPDKQSFLKKLLGSPPSEKRIGRVENIERNSYVTGAGKKLFLAYVKLMQPFNRKFEGKKLSKVLRSLGKNITEPMREVVLRNLLFSYRSLSDKEIEEYAGFLSSPSGNWFNQTLLTGFEKGLRKASYKAGLIQVKLLEEIDSGGPEYPLLKDMVPPGQRYLLIGRRDPFRPLVNSQGLIDFSEEQPPVSVARLFGGELKDIPPVALLVFKKIEDQHPELYRKLKKFERLFNNQDELEELDDEEYAQVVEDYRDALERSSNIYMDESPLQVEYDTLRMTGIIKKKMEVSAMFEVGSTGYTVKKGDRIGPFFGYVEEIQNGQVVVIEQFRDYLGNILTNQKIIQFYQGSPDEGNTNS